MASIKEKAAALNLAEKLCVRPQAHGVSMKSVRSSCVWNGLIPHLKASVAVKPRRLYLKSHSDCFLGSEAVDVLEEYLKGLKGLEGVSVPRPKVVCVCQTLLDCRVFEAVGTKVFGKDRKQDVFQDSKSSLYRFVRACTPSLLELERSALANGIQNLFCPSPSDRPMERTSASGADAEASSGADAEASSGATHTHTPSQAEQCDAAAAASLPPGPLTHSLGPGKVQNHTELSQSMVEEVWQEQILLKLLKLVEIPLLEGLLQCIQSPSPAQRDPEVTSSSNHLDRQVLKAFRDSQRDEWLCAALDCLAFVPDPPVEELCRELPRCLLEHGGCEPSTVAGGSDAAGECLCAPPSRRHGDDEQPRLSRAGEGRWKLLLFEALVKHYGRADGPPLLPQHMSQVYAAIADLLVTAQWAAALEALQLCLKLLPPACRDELCRLLTFMVLAADPQEVKLDKELENRLVVKRSFSKAIIHNTTLSKDKEDLMVVFMLSNIKEIFKIPSTLHKEVSDKLACLAEGKPADAVGSMFCNQVCERTYINSTQDTTKQELWNLLKSIHLDDKLSSKERKRLLGQFYRAHPETFNQYFGELAVSVL